MSKATSRRGVSLRALQDLDADEVPAFDTRPQELRELTIVSSETLETISSVFSGTELANDQARIRVILETQRAVNAAWERAARSFLEIGRALNTLDNVLFSREEKNRLKSSFEEFFPFSEPVASQFRRIAHVVDSGRLDETFLPGSYSAAYQLSLLAPEELDIARAQGLVGPNTSRSAIIAFRKSIKRNISHVDFAALSTEARRLKSTRKHMLEQLIAIRTRLKEIQTLLDED